MDDRKIGKRSSAARKKRFFFICDLANGKVIDHEHPPSLRYGSAGEHERAYQHEHDYENTLGDLLGQRGCELRSHAQSRASKIRGALAPEGTIVPGLCLFAPSISPRKFS